MKQLINDCFTEVKDYFILGILVFVCVFIIAKLGEVTGLIDLSNSVILLLAGCLAIGVPLGIIPAIKFLQRQSKRNSL